MHPLSAIRQFAPADLQSLPLPGADARLTPIPIQEVQELPSPIGPLQTGITTESSFGSIFSRLVGEVSEKQAAAGDAVNALLSGKNVSLHQAMIAMEEASVSFQLMVEVRNKLLESYQELMRMQI